MTTIITREVGTEAKNAPLTNAELDANFINLNANKLEKPATLVANSILYSDGTEILSSPHLKWDGSVLTAQGSVRAYSNLFLYSEVSDRLNVVPQAAGSGVLAIATNNANTDYTILTIDGSQHVFSTYGTERVRINGTSLTVTGKVAATTLSIGSPANPYSRPWALKGFGYISWGIGDGVEIYHPSTDDYTYFTSEAAGMTWNSPRTQRWISAGGTMAWTGSNLGIGTASVTPVWGATTQIGSGTGAVSLSLVGASGSGFFAVNNSGAAQLIARAATVLQLGANDAATLTIALDGNITSYGALNTFIGPVSGGGVLRVQSQANYDGNLSLKNTLREWRVGMLGSPGWERLSFYDVTASAERAYFETDGTFVPLSGVQMAEHILRWNESGVRSWAMYASSGSIRIDSGDGYGSLVTNGSLVSGRGFVTVGAYPLSASGVPGVISYEYPVTRHYIGDGTGYSWALSKRSSSVTTDLVTVTDAGDVGIGTSLPSGKLNVVGTGDMSGIFESTGTNNAASVIIRSGNGTTSGRYAYARFVNNDTNAQEWRIGTYGNNNLSIVNAKAGTTPVVLDTSGNLGLGATPSAWGASQKAIDIGYSGALKSSAGSGSVVSLANNAYYTTAWTYKVTGQAAALYDLRDTGEHRWYIAPSGTAGNAITFTQAMTLDAAGNLGLGVTPSAWRSVFNAVDIGRASLAGATGSAQFQLAANAFQNSAGNWIYRTTDTAIRFEGVNGIFSWHTAASGTAGAAITFTQAMTLDANGVLLLGATAAASSEGYRFYKNYGRYDNGTFTGYLGAGSSLGSGTASDFAIRSDNALAFLTGGGFLRMTLNAAGNLGLGVTPFAWGASTRGIDLVGNVGFASLGNSDAFVLSNAYYNGTNWIYKSSSTAVSVYRAATGSHTWYTAAAGTAGGSITLTQAMMLDANGCLGLGATPSGWESDSKTVDVGAYTSVSNVAGYQAVIANNAYYNGGYKYRTSGYVASAFVQANGGFQWQTTSTSGTAGNAIAFTQAMTLDANGNLGLGVTPPAWNTGGNIALSNTRYIASSGSAIGLMANAYYGSSWTYTSTAAASWYSQSAGAHAWYTAPSGTAGAAIGWTTAMTLDAAGNLGMGVTPSGWGALKAIDVSSGGGFFGYTAQAGITNNAYFNGSNWVYKSTAAASMFRASGATFEWHVAGSGTAGNAISLTQAMTLDATGNLCIGRSSAPAGVKLLVSNAGNLGFEFNPTHSSGTIGMLEIIDRSSGDYKAMRTNALSHSWYYGASLTLGASLASDGRFYVGGSSSAKFTSTVADGTFQGAFVGTTHAIRFNAGNDRFRIEAVDPTLTASYQPLQLGGSYIILAVGGTAGATLDSTGFKTTANLSVGGALNTWSTGNVAQINSASLFGDSGQTILSNNAYYNSGWKRYTTNVANQISLSAGMLLYNYAATGAADSAITWTEGFRVDASGNMGLGVVPTYKLDVLSGAAVAVRARSSNSDTVGIIESAGTATSLLRFINTGANNVYIGSVSGSLVAYTNGVLAMTLNTSGVLEVSEAGTGSGSGGFTASTATHNGNAGMLFKTNSANRWNITTAGTNGATLRIYSYATGAAAATWDASSNLVNAGSVTTSKALFSAKAAVSASDIDVSTANAFSKTISGNTTFTVSNVPASGTLCAFTLDLTNGGAYTITWWSGVKWAGGSAPTLTASGRDRLVFMTTDGGTTWDGAVVGKAFA